MIHCTYNTWMLANGTGTAGVKAGGTTWFFLTPNYSFGQAMRRDTSAAVVRAGARYSRRLPIRSQPPRTSPPSWCRRSPAAPRSSDRPMPDRHHQLGQTGARARSYLPWRWPRLAGLLALLNNVRVAGLEASQGMLLTEPFYRDLEDRTRAVHGQGVAAHPVALLRDMVSTVSRWIAVKGQGPGAVHTGFSPSDGTCWRWVYGGDGDVEPATPEEAANCGLLDGAQQCNRSKGPDLFA